MGKLWEDFCFGVFELVDGFFDKFRPKTETTKYETFEAETKDGTPL